MKNRKLFNLTVIIITSNALMGCAATSKSELQQMIDQSQQIEIEIAEPISEEQGDQQSSSQWIQLDQLDTYKDFRVELDDIMNIVPYGEGSKNGIAYVGLDGSQEGNNTLHNAFMNRKFVSNFYEDDASNLKLQQAVNSVYADTDESNYMVAALNAYWNLSPDAEPNYFNPGQTLTRLEAMSLVARASNQVTEGIGNDSFTTAVASKDNMDFIDLASLVESSSYLKTADKSLNSLTADGKMSRGEYVYLIVNNVFGSGRMGSTDIKKASFNDCKNGGDIASKEKISAEDQAKDYYENCELAFVLKNPDVGCPEDMFRALATAQELGIISSETRWDEAVTKEEAIQLYVDTLQAYTSENGYTVDAVSGQGDTSGEIVEAEKPVEKGDPSNGTDTAGTDNQEGLTDDEINAEILEEENSIPESAFEIIPMDETLMYCTSGSANLRTGPSTDYEKVGSISYAQEITVNGKVETADSVWYVIKTDGDTQMVSGSLLSTTKPAPRQSTQPSGGGSQAQQPSGGGSSTGAQEQAPPATDPAPSDGGGSSSGGLEFDGDAWDSGVTFEWTDEGWGGLQ